MSLSPIAQLAKLQLTSNLKLHPKVLQILRSKPKQHSRTIVDCRMSSLLPKLH
jgi:hypothetical protein